MIEMNPTQQANGPRLIQERIGQIESKILQKLVRSMLKDNGDERPDLLQL